MRQSHFVGRWSSGLETPGTKCPLQAAIMAGTRPGSIILSHDIHPPTIEAMPQVFDALLAKGFKLVTVSELVAMTKGGERPEVTNHPDVPPGQQHYLTPAPLTLPGISHSKSRASTISPTEQN